MRAKSTFSRVQQLSLSLFTMLAMATTTLAGNQDPLSPNEQLQASTLVESTLPSLKTKSSSNQYELLLVERDRSEDKKSGVRRSNAFVYDYQTDETIVYRIDTATNKILSSVRRKNLQLPLTENEIARTVNLIFADKETFELIANEYQRITGKVLNSSKDLEAKAFVFTADTLPEQLNSASQQCGLHRCAQILLYTHDSVVFEVSPVVNLSANLITQVIGF